MKQIFALLCMIWMLFSCALAEVSLEDIFFFEHCVNQELQQQSNYSKEDMIFEQPEANRVYIEKVLSYAQTLNEIQEVNGLRFTALRAVAVNDLYILEWEIENISGETRLLGEGAVMVDNAEAQSYIDGGLSGRVLLAGECAKGIVALHHSGVMGDTCTLAIEYYELRIDEELVPEDRTQPVEINEEVVEILCTEVFKVQLVRSFEEPLLYLTESKELEWKDSTLCVTEAMLDISGGTFTMMRIFNSKEEALQNNPVSQDNGWDFMMIDGTDEDRNFWYQNSTGYIDDEPVQLDDGRYAYRFNREVYFMNYLPESLNLVIRTPGSEGQFVSDWDLVFHFNLE